MLVIAIRILSSCLVFILDSIGLLDLLDIAIVNSLVGILVLEAEPGRLEGVGSILSFLDFDVIHANCEQDHHAIRLKFTKR